MHNLCKNKKKIPLRISRGLKWENKTYKLKRSINSFFLAAEVESVKIGPKEPIHAAKH